MKKYFIGVGIIGVVFLASFVYASPQYFVGFSTNTGSVASNASSSPVYMTPGTATSTVTHNALLLDQVNGASKGTSAFALNTATLLVQFTATTGTPTLNIEIEDSRNGIDWYRRTTSIAASTTNPFVAGDIAKIQTIFASTTAAEGGAAVSETENIMQLSFSIEPRLQYMRAIGYLSSTTIANIKRDDAALYMEFVPTKEWTK